MKTWKKLMSGLMTTLLVLTTIMVPAAASPAITVKSGEITDAATVLPVYLEITNDGVGGNGNQDTLWYQITDTDGLLTGSAGANWTVQNYQVTVPADGDPYQFPIDLAIAGTPVAGQSYNIVVGLAASGNGMFATTLGDQGTPTFIDTTLTITPTIANPTELQDGLIDDIDFDDNDYAPGETVEVELTLEDANADYNDVTVEAWIADPDGDRVGTKEETSEFNLYVEDDEEVVTFEFDIPSDADEGVYTLHVVVESDEGQLDLSSSETFDVERADNSMYFESVDIGSAAIAGETLDFAVTLFNNGLEDENDVRTSVTISGVGVSQTSSYFTVEEDDDAVRYFTLQLPGTMTAGNYQVTFRAWNGDVDIVETREIVVANAAGTTISGMSGVYTNVDAASKMVSTGTGGAYVLTVVNNEDRVVSYSISTAGTEGWATTLINPTTVSLAPGSAAQVQVFVSPDEGTEGLHQFSVYVKDGATIVDSLALTANVVAGQSDDFDLFNTSTSLLAVVVVVLAVLWVWKRDNAPRAPKKRKSKKKEVYY